jgi:quercetin dioxygenase-like cupin family protein
MPEHVRLDSHQSREIVPGFHARFVHTDRITLAYWDIREGASLPEHSHPHEQTVNVIDGVFHLTVDGELFEMTEGSVVLIPPDVPHSGKALTDCRVIDVFAPVREDYA